MNKFFIVSRSRTGSNLVRTMLDSHPDVFADREIFGRLNGTDPAQALRDLYARGDGHRAVGCKVFYYHPQDGNPDELWAMLHEMEEATFLHLTRHNVLAAILSSEIAFAQKNWSSWRKAERDGNLAVRIDPGELRTHYLQTLDQEDSFRRDFADRDIVEITYEDVRAGGSGSLQAFLDSLGVPRHPLRTTLARQRTASIEECIVNAAELQAEFPATDYPRLRWTDEGR